ncbi:hypothetical protein DWY36_12905 [Firmicutes bacterium AF25-13AC]|jgi:predicted  nucleic acid-binding Zn-ribbon protein|nr:hypothetical protein DWY36_12905 [Firmicutes bacterium AF25-13AC]
MSWWNPTEEEAQDQYYYYRGKYNDALHDKQYWERQEENSREQLRQIDSRIVDCKAQKKSNNKQIEEIKRIIAMLEGNSMSSVNVPNVIETANSTIKDMNESFKKSICVSGVNAADLEIAFGVKSVQQDMHSAQALELLHTEKIALEQLNEQLDSQMTTLDANMDSLKRQITQCNIQQNQIRKDMYSYAFDMNHFRKFMYY